MDTTTRDGARASLGYTADSAIDSKLQDTVSPTNPICSDVNNVDHESLDSSQVPSLADEAGQSSFVTGDSYNGTELKEQDVRTIKVCYLTRRFFDSLIIN